VKTVSRKVPVPPLLHQRHNAAIRLLYKLSFDPRSNLILRHLLYKHSALSWCKAWPEGKSEVSRKQRNSAFRKKTGTSWSYVIENMSGISGKGFRGEQRSLIH